MSLPSKAVDRLFDRLTATYGRAFTDIYAGLDLNAVKSAWAHELDGFGTESGMRSLAWALENLPERAPNAVQFRNLARQAPAPQAPRLPEPKADPARLRAELEKLGPAMAAMRGAPAPGGLDWARRIVERYDSGAKVAPAVLKIARDALVARAAVGGVE